MECLYGAMTVIVVVACYFWYQRRKRSGLALAREFEEVTRTSDAPVNPIEKALLASSAADERGGEIEIAGGKKLTLAQAQVARDIRAFCERANPSVVLYHRRGLIFTVTRVGNDFVIIRHNYVMYPPNSCRYVCFHRIEDGIFFMQESSTPRADNVVTDGMKPLPPKTYDLLLEELEATYRKV